MVPLFLKSPEEIETFCNHIKQNELFITVDTEFYRKSTYFAELCLLQIGTSDNIIFLDPKEDKENNFSHWKPFFEIMEDKSIQKVFHAPFEDLEIFSHLMGKPVQGIFDTQIAAAFLNFGLSASYQTLSHSFLGKELDKSAQQTDWRHRPLTNNQIEYAADDVLYLREIYTLCVKKLQEKNRLSWALEEMVYWEDAQTFTSFVPETYKRLASDVLPEKAPLLYALLSWREETAKTLNISRKRIITEEDLVFCIRYKRGEAFFANLSKKIPSQIDIQTVQDYIYGLDPALVPSLPFKRTRLTQEEKGFYELLKILLQEVSKEEGIASSLLASKEDLLQFSHGETQEDLSFLKGWRRDVFGNKALALQEGKLSAVYKDKKVQFLEIEN